MFCDENTFRSGTDQPVAWRLICFVAEKFGLFLQVPLVQIFLSLFPQVFSRLLYV